jgi:hypothetical protein
MGVGQDTESRWREKVEWVYQDILTFKESANYMEMDSHYGECDWMKIPLLRDNSHLCSLALLPSKIAVLRWEESHP